MQPAVPEHVVIETFPVGPLGCNCTLIGDTLTGKGLVIDPGWDAELILERVRALGISIVTAVHTHAHIDHINGTRGVHDALGTPAEVHEADLPLYEGIEQQGALLRMWGIPFETHEPPPPGRLIGDGDLVGGGSFEMEVLHTPGHTPGSLSFLLKAGDQDVLFAGDTLFREGVGRTDLWGGDHLALKESIRKRLYVLPTETLVVPGHGPATTIGHERRFNPFVTG